jgi:hypothetical protein
MPLLSGWDIARNIPQRLKPPLSFRAFRHE